MLEPITKAKAAGPAKEAVMEAALSPNIACSHFCKCPAIFDGILGRGRASRRAGTLVDDPTIRLRNMLPCLRSGFKRCDGA
jgi:hypothetical protein